MDVFERRKMLKEMSDPNVSSETIAKWQKRLGEMPVEENYGKQIEMTVEKASSGSITLVDAVCGDEHYKGQMVDAVHAGNTNRYFVAQSWIRGKGISVEEAYRVFGETGKTMAVRKVTSHSELESIASGLYTSVRRMLDKPKD